VHSDPGQAPCAMSPRHRATDRIPDTGAGRADDYLLCRVLGNSYKHGPS
jgi:hypothetical protein